MTEIKPRVGERWRVTIEGTIKEFFDSSTSKPFVALTCGEWHENLWLNAHTWERLPDPEPEWQPGDLVIDANDVVWRRWDGKIEHPLVWSLSTDKRPHFLEDKPARPLRRLVIEGEQ